MEIDITPYILPINENQLEGDKDEGTSSVGSTDERLTRKRKREDDDEDGPEAKRMQQGIASNDDAKLKKKLRYPDEGPSRWRNCDGEAEVTDLTTPHSEAEEDDDFNNEVDEDSFIDDDEEEESEEIDDDEPNINNFIMEMKVAPTYSPRGKALSEWDPDFWRGF